MTADRGAMREPEPISESWARGYRAVFAAAGLADFGALWGLELEPVEPENRARGGRSGVARLDLGSAGTFYLKRQEGFMTRSWRPPFARIPTVEREWLALSRLAAEGFAVAPPVHLARQGERGLLVTAELPALGPIDRALDGLGPRRRLALVRALGGELARFHGLGLRHGALYPKHLLLLAEEPPRFGFIDLEKCRPVLFPALARRRDLDALNRRSPGFGRGERLAFLEGYLGERRAGWRSLWRALARRARRKGKRST